MQKIMFKKNSGLSPEQLQMLEPPTKRNQLIKISPVVKLSKSSSILKSNGKSMAISARKAGRQRLRPVTRWDASKADTEPWDFR